MGLTDLIGTILLKAKTDKIYEKQISTILEQLEDIDLNVFIYNDISDLIDIANDFDISELLNSEDVKTLLNMSIADRDNLMSIYDIYSSNDIEDISNGEFTFDCDLKDENITNTTLEDYFFNKNLSILSKLVSNQELEEIIKQKEIEKKIVLW